MAGLFCEQLPCWSSEWAVLRSSIFVSGVPCAKPKSTKAYLKDTNLETGVTKYSSISSIHCSLLVYLYFFHLLPSMLLIGTVTVLFSPFDSSCPILPIPTMFLHYTHLTSLFLVPKSSQVRTFSNGIKKIFPATPSWGSSNPTALNLQPTVKCKWLDPWRIPMGRGKM